MLKLFPILCLLFLVSCAKTDEQVLDSAKQEAKYYLSDNNCAKAKKVLDDAGFENDDAEYVSLYASVYACQAGYSEFDLLGEVSTIAAASNQLLGSLTTLASSNETAPDSTNYTSIMSAIDVILNSAGTTPSAAAREAKFGVTGATNLSFQALYLILVEFGKFMQLYGNTDAAGDKSDGSFTNTCIFTYTQSDAANYVNGVLPTCNSAGGDEGSDFLESPVTDDEIDARLCEGIYLFNNLRDILTNVTIGDSSTFGSLKDVGDVLNTMISDAEAAESGGLNGEVAYQDSIQMIKDITSKSDCEALPRQRLEKWYAIIFETGLPDND
ncbi:MAG: hypothetical protein CME64_10685 [Halobacteriovoraceae bacterium]|nr:hypothetical protein [Halobacteriovoraceae bacterium]